MEQSLTICDFLDQSGALTTFYDMGRRVIEIPRDTIRRFELTDLPYPQPFLRSAWLGILIQYPGNKSDSNKTHKRTHHIWFLKLPLDEQGLLLQAARDDFLHRLLQSLSESSAEDTGPQALDDNPHGFTPREDKMAVFHAKVSRKLAEPPSQYYSHARNYFSGLTGFDQWNFVGLQGIADVSVRLEEEDNEQILTQAIPFLPATPFTALCGCLENISIGKKLTTSIADRINEALANGDAMMTAAGIRGLSNSQDLDTQNTVIQAVLKNPVGRHIEVLAAIAGRCWKVLENSELRLIYLEALALCEAGEQAFQSILADLLFLPDLRLVMKADFDNPRRSATLIKAINSFRASIQTPPDK